jgi:hypothetical protein
MEPTIRVGAVSDAPVAPPGTAPARVRLLPGAIDGVETHYYIQGSGTLHVPAPHPIHGRVLFFTCGAGEVRVERTTWAFAEMAAFLAEGEAPVSITATAGPLEYLEILIAMPEMGAAHLQPTGPFFVRYSECEPYAEAIKTPTTISRTIVPAHTLPRFCMGSVQARGPDAVAPHAHLVLEQLFFGLPGNRCMVTADRAEALLGDRSLLHIPSGSWHGVRVGEGQTMHYLWMDFFKQEEDLAYIQEQHAPIKA